MKRKSFSCNRFYNLRHELETDYHEDYEYANAVAYGEINSIEKTDNNVLKVLTKRFSGNGVLEQYEVSISYPDGDIDSSDHSSFIGSWFDEMPESNPAEVSFDCCVFEAPISLKGYRSIRFQNCFFLDSVSIEDCPECRMISFEHCVFKDDLTISKCQSDNLFIRNCNNLQSLMMDDCVVGKWTSIHDVYVKMAFFIWNSVFSGHEYTFHRVKIGYGLEVLGCVFESPAEMSLCRLEEMRVRNCTFNQLNVHDIFTNRYLECEELVRPSNESACPGDCESCDDPYCNLTPRER